MNKTMIAVFDNKTQAKDAVRALFDSGFSHSEVSLMSNNTTEPESLDTYRHPGAAEMASDIARTHADHVGDHTAVKGAATGGVLGGLAGLLLGLGTLAVPGVGPVVAAGPVATMLVGAAGGAAIGGIMGALIEMGVPEDDAHIYSEALRRGSTMVAVTGPESKVQTVSEIFRRFHPIDIKQRSENWRAEGWARFDDTREPLTGDAIVTERSRYASVR